MLYMLDSLSLYLAYFETHEGNGMFLSMDCLLAATPLVIIIICYIIILAKLKLANESSEFSKLLRARIL